MLGPAFDGPVHACDLAVRPRMLHLREAMLDLALIAGPIEDMMEGVLVAGLIGEREAVVDERSMDRTDPGRRRTER